MKILKRDDILKELQTLLGLRGEGSASGDTSALENSLTEGINHCWRYRDWSWAIKRGSTELVDGHYLLPEDFDYTSWYKVKDQDIGNIREFERPIYIQPHGDRFEIVGLNDNLDIVYQTAPPAEDIMFPSQYVLALAGAIHQKEKDNPNSADITQEWNLLNTKLDLLVGKEQLNQPKIISPRRRTAISKHEIDGGFTGNVG